MVSSESNVSSSSPFNGESLGEFVTLSSSPIDESNSYKISKNKHFKIQHLKYNTLRRINFLPLGEPAIVTLGLFGHSGDKHSYISKRSELQLELAVAVTGERVFPFEFSIELKELAVVVDSGT